MLILIFSENIVNPGNLHLFLYIFQLILQVLMHLFQNEMKFSLEQDEELFRQIYGDETYEQFRKMIEEGDL